MRLRRVAGGPVEAAEAGVRDAGLVWRTRRVLGRTAVLAEMATLQGNRISARRRPINAMCTGAPAASRAMRRRCPPLASRTAPAAPRCRICSDRHRERMSASAAAGPRNQFGPKTKVKSMILTCSRFIPTHNQNPLRFWSARDRAANSFGVSPSRLVWGRSVL